MYQPFDLSGRGVVITGGNGGIGLRHGARAAGAGAKVSIWGSAPRRPSGARRAGRRMW
jgi:NAD(P)-dependent dehydrogenase (short-subunit alcohol dehydrogenase family)